MFKSVNKYLTSIVDILLHNVDEGGCLYIVVYPYLLYAALLLYAVLWCGKVSPEEHPDNTCSTERV